MYSLFSDVGKFLAMAVLLCAIYLYFVYLFRHF